LSKHYSRSLRDGYPARPTNTGHLLKLFVPNPREQGRPSVQRQPSPKGASGFAYELRDEDKAEAYVVVPVVRVVVVFQKVALPCNRQIYLAASPVTAKFIWRL